MKSRKRSSRFHRTTSLRTICICKVENTRRFHQPTQRKTMASTSRKGHRRVARGLRLIGHYAQSSIVFSGTIEIEAWRCSTGLHRRGPIMSPALIALNFPSLQLN